MIDPHIDILITVDDRVNIFTPKNICFISDIRCEDKIIKVQWRQLIFTVPE